MERKRRLEEGAKILFWNVVEIKNKDEEFWEFIKEHEIVGLTETWLEDKE